MGTILTLLVAVLTYGPWDGPQGPEHCRPEGAAGSENGLCIDHDENAGTLSVFRNGDREPILTQVAQEDTRPYIHPIIAPDGKGVLTQFRPEHHPHQTGLYWGFKEFNGRDYFMACCSAGRWQGDYYRRVSAKVLEERGEQVRWQTVYDLLDEEGDPILTETQTWTMREEEGKFLLDLEWRGEAKAEVTVGKFYVGGLFLRMPWHEGSVGEVVNASGQRNGEAEAQRAIWADIGIQVEGRDDLAHIAFFDHPNNKGFPIPWRVDNELGIGPSRQIMGDWKLEQGETEVVRYRLVAYTGTLDAAELTRAWTEFASTD